MPMGSRQVVWGLSASLAALALVPGCGGAGPTPGKTTAGEAATGSQPAVSTTGATTGATTPATTPAIAAAPAPKTTKWIDLAVGDCLADPPPTDPSVVTVTVVDCATAHAAEVYLRASVAVNAAVAEVANRECAGGFSQYTGRALDGGQYAVTYLIDSNQDRTASDPAPSTVICLLYAAGGGPLSESARR